MKTSVGNFNLISFEEALKPSPLEEEYIKLYGKEFVEDLKKAYRWMKKDMKKQPLDVVCRRRNTYHEIGDWITVFYVDFRNESFYSQTIDDLGEKTIFNHGYSPCLKANSGHNHNIKYLLSGLYCYDRDKTKKWLDTLLGPGGRFWAEKA